MTQPNGAAPEGGTVTDASKTGDSGGTGSEGSKSTFQPITTQEQFDQMIGSRLAHERAKYSDYETLKQKAAEFDKAQEASMSELQKAQARAEKAEAELNKINTERQRSALVTEVATAKGVDPALLSRMIGATKEELEASADLLPKANSNQGQKPSSQAKRVRDLMPPTGGDGKGPSGKAQAAAALRQLYGK